jgi:hypothetical protein
MRSDRSRGAAAPRPAEEHPLPVFFTRQRGGEGKAAAGSCRETAPDGPVELAGGADRAPGRQRQEGGTRGVSDGLDVLPPADTAVGQSGEKFEPGCG